MRPAKKSAVEKRAARRFGEFARSVRRNLRQAQRILERAEQATHRCYEKAGAAMLEAKTTSAMSEERFAAWLAPFGLSQDRLIQCLELGQVALDHRKVDAAEREESCRTIVREMRAQVSQEAMRREEKQWALQREESGRPQEELTR
jgi:hypothetical protein